jgi:hypothetical protein
MMLCRRSAFRTFLHCAPDSYNTEVSRELGNIAAVHQIATNFQDAGDIPQVFFRSTVSIIQKLAENHIFRRGNICELVRKYSDSSSTLQLRGSPRSFAGDHKVDFVTGSRMNDIELSATGDRFGSSGGANIKVRLGKRPTKRVNLTRL